jgi:hypothetical protein
MACFEQKLYMYLCTWEMFWLLEQLIGNAEDLEPLSPFSRPIKCQWLGVSLSMQLQIEKMKFPASNNTKCYLYLLFRVCIICDVA